MRKIAHRREETLSWLEDNPARHAEAGEKACAGCETAEHCRTRTRWVYGDPASCASDRLEVVVEEMRAQERPVGEADGACGCETEGRTDDA